MNYMIIFNSSYYGNSEIDIPNNDVPLLVTSAGHHTLKTLSHFDTVRPAGRRDFQVLYVKRGSIHYTVNDETHIAPRGSFLFYHPYMPHLYTYYLNESADIFWLHFTGAEAENKLRNFKLFDKMCYHAEFDKKYEQIYDNIISELSLKSLHFSEVCTNLLDELLCLISRNIDEAQPLFSDTIEEIKGIIHLFNNEFSRQFNINDLAVQHNLSVSWLTRLFKKQFNMSPQRYLTQVRMEKAKVMLHSTNSISDIALAVGYNDPLYFSRVFHKTMGISPSEYRKQNTEIDIIPIEDAPWNKM